MRRKRKQNKFYRYIYLSLILIALQPVIYFAKGFLGSSPAFAQTQIESTPREVTNPSPLITAPQAVTFKLPILIYHYVEYVTDKRDTIRKSLNIQPQVFEAQINTLKEAGYTFITPSQIAKIESGEEKIGKPIIISFDDGYRDFYDDVFPLLKKNNVKAVTYIVPGFLDHLNYMYWNQVEEISQSNLIEVGAHSMHHPSLDRLSDQVATEEIDQSKLILELSLGRQITTFAYPYGHFNSRTVELVKSDGFTSALTTVAGVNENINEKFTLKRIHPGTRTGEDLLRAIN